MIWPEASKAQNNMAAVSAEGSTVWVLIRRLNSSCKRSIAFDVRIDFHWLFGNRVKVNSLSPASSRLSATARHFSRHLRMNALRLASTSGFEFGIDHVVVIGGDFLVQPVGRMRKEIAMLVHGAALDRHVAPERGQSFSRPGAPSIMTSSGVFRRNCQDFRVKAGFVRPT